MPSVVQPLIVWMTQWREVVVLQVWDHHTEFAVGLDFSVLAEGVIGSTGWDEMAYVWRQDGDPRGPVL